MGLSSSKLVCGTFKMNAWDSSHPLSHQPQSLLVFIARSHGNFCYIFVTPTSLKVASVCPQLEDFCLDRLHVTPNDGCFVISCNFDVLMRESMLRGGDLHHHDRKIFTVP